MKPDLIERLNDHAERYSAHQYVAGLCSEASNEIERLREALGELVSMYEGVCGNLPFGMMGRSEIAADLAKARAALQPILPSEGGRGESSSSISERKCEGTIAFATVTPHSAGGD